MGLIFLPLSLRSGGCTCLYFRKLKRGAGLHGGKIGRINNVSELTSMRSAPLITFKTAATKLIVNFAIQDDIMGNVNNETQKFLP